MDKKGQTALEYLMTYGWALVVIVIVIAALVILVGTPSAGDSCTGSTKFTVPSLADSGGNLVLVMTNVTGQEINTITITATDSNTAATGVPDPWSGGTTDEDITFTGILTSGTTYTEAIAIVYNDQYGNPHTETISCSGTAD